MLMLVKTIKQLGTTPVLPAQDGTASADPSDPLELMREGKGLFFFRLVSLPSDIQLSLVH